MIPYILFIAVMLVLHRCRWPKAMVVVLVLFAALRYDTGWDYHMYTTFSSESGHFYAQRQYSWFWVMMFDIGRYTGLRWLPISIVSIMTYVLLYVGIKSLYKRNCGGIADALLVYGLWPYLYLSSFSIIRQALAMAIIVCIFAELNSRHKLVIKAAVLVVMYYAAFVAHPSSLLMLLLIPVYIFRKLMSLKLALIVFASAIFILGSLQLILGMIDIKGMAHYIGYLDSGQEVGGLIWLLLAAIEVYLIVAGMQKKRRLLSVEFQQAYFLSVIGVGMLAMVYGVLNSAAISRAADYPAMFMIFAIYPCISMFKYGNKLRPYIGLAMAALMLFFLVYTDAGVTVGMSSSRYLPYKTFLEAP